MHNVIQKIAFSLFTQETLSSIKKAYYPWRLRFCSGESHESDFKAIKRLVHPGDLVIDVGANIGGYTNYLSRLVGSQGRVYSVEPIPCTFGILRSNVKKLGLKNVELFNCAISDEDGYVLMEVPKYESGLENYYQARIVHRDKANVLTHVKAASRTLDSLFSHVTGIVSFIKCDVEGHELHCIRGATHIMKGARPAWHIEISDDPDDVRSNSYQAFSLLKEAGYRAFWFAKTSLKERREGDRSINYFFLAHQHIKTLREYRLVAS